MEALTARFIESYNYLKSKQVISNDTDFASRLGVSRSMVTEILKGRSNPGGKALQNLVTEFKIDGTWLLSGLGVMVPELLPKTANTPSDYMHISEPETGVFTNSPQRPYKPLAKNRAKSDPPTDTPTHEIGVKTLYLTPQIITVDNEGNENILHVSAKAAAGYPAGHADPEYLQRLPSFRMPGLTDATYRSFEVDGDSMFPTLKDKQMIIGRWVEKLEYIREDRVYVVVTKTGTVVKRLINRIERDGVIYAKSDATNDRQLYKTYPIQPTDILELWYGVFHGGFDFQSPADMWKRVNNHETDLIELQNTVSTLLDIVKGAGLLPG